MAGKKKKISLTSAGNFSGTQAEKSSQESTTNLHKNQQQFYDISWKADDLSCNQRYDPQNYDY